MIRVVQLNVEARDEDGPDHARIDEEHVVQKTNEKIEGADILSPGSLEEDGETDHGSEIAENVEKGNHVSVQVDGNIIQYGDEVTLR